MHRIKKREFNRDDHLIVARFLKITKRPEAGDRFRGLGPSIEQLLSQPLKLWASELLLFEYVKDEGQGGEVPAGFVKPREQPAQAFPQVIKDRSVHHQHGNEWSP